MSERRNPQTDRGKTNQRSGENLRRRCKCGRIIAGNAAWWSHTNSRDALAYPAQHGYGGRA